MRGEGGGAGWERGGGGRGDGRRLEVIGGKATSQIELSNLSTLLIGGIHILLQCFQLDLWRVHQFW